jgi:hypothetical protein
MKKTLRVGMLFLTLTSAALADDFTSRLQDLAMQTACLGRYSSAETGVMVTSRYDDPPDWYDPPMMANRFATMSGNMTRTNTFYGVCFDYAEFAWNDILDYQEWYNEAGMKDQQWYIAAANAGDPYTIILYDPASPENATTVSNGVYLKEIARHNVTTHDKASGHAWLWVQHNDGTWYWIDPTWTDNTGYVWWGIVENDREVQYYPDPAYCVANDYPRPPRPDETETEKETRSPDSTYARYRYTPQFTNATLSMGLGFGYISDFDFAFSKKYGFTISLEDHVPYNFAVVSSLSLDYLANKAGPVSLDSLILGLTLGYQMYSIFVVYAGGGLGVTFPMDDEWLAWKVNGGLRIQFSRFFTKLDVSYGTILGPSCGIGAGIFF